MSRLVTILLVAATLPVMGAEPFSLELLPRETESFSLDTLKKPKRLPFPSTAFERFVKDREAGRLNALNALLQAPRTCYYIRQLNANLRKPKDNPQVVPLADQGAAAETAPGTTSKPECMTDAVVRNTRAR
jgi:hypothetical protein